MAVDAARILAGFDEIDRLAQLETGALQLEEGESDLRDVVTRTLRRLDGVLRPRSARIELIAQGGPFTIGMAGIDAMQALGEPAIGGRYIKREQKYARDASC